MCRKLTPACVLCTADLGDTSASHPSDTAPFHPRSRNCIHSSKVPTPHPLVQGPDRHCTVSSEVPKPHPLVQGPIGVSKAAKPGGAHIRITAAEQTGLREGRRAQDVRRAAPQVCSGLPCHCCQLRHHLQKHTPPPTVLPSDSCIWIISLLEGETQGQAVSTQRKNQ